MLSKPALADETIRACLLQDYAIETRALDYLALGNDTYAGVYRVVDAHGQTFFLKAKRDRVARVSLTLPYALRARGLSCVVAPLPTRTHELCALCADYTLILYPFVRGENGFRRMLSPAQWRAYGSFLRQLHAVSLPAALASAIPREKFAPEWGALRDALEAKIDAGDFESEPQRVLAAQWRNQERVIQTLAARTHELAEQLGAGSHEFVLCHADIHTGNVLVGDDGQLSIVDWDQPIFAPRERDLFFVIDSVIGFPHTRAQQELFFQGYGAVEINAAALAYYRCDWAMYDICEFAARVMLLPDVTEEIQADASRWFNVQFEPNGMVELALGAPAP